MSGLEAIQYVGNDSDLLKFTAGNLIVFNSFHQPVIQHPDAAPTVVGVCDWVFRYQGRLYACSDVLWPVVSELIAANTELALSNDALSFQANAANAELGRLTGDRIALNTITGEMREALGVETGGPWEMCERVLTELRLLREQRDRVLALHVEHEGRCTHCVEWCDCPNEDVCTHGNVEWPCPTAAVYGVTGSSQGEGGEPK